MCKKKREVQDELLDILEVVTRIFQLEGVEAHFEVFMDEEPYIIQAAFKTTLPKVAQIIQECENKYGICVEWGVVAEEVMPAPCTFDYEYFLQIIKE